MILIFYTYLIPRFNWERERRGFNNFRRSMAMRAGFYAGLLDGRKG